ncbi:hypothetical protein H5410_006652 [Solanum commersonii]|uniref:Retrotransposon gag domain-containing protein n=1 Tax=Solanum commersonii TaxID=4109 RepID=A0A9J6AB49_SOLCO|nr:hypothetical protein H5410_006652 [Solanum commersonii]
MVKVIFIHFDDIAIEWHFAYIRSRNHIPLPSWEEYVYALMDRFGAEYVGPKSKLKLVKHIQIDLIEDYQKEIDKIMTRLVLLPEYAFSAFITGLKPEIRPPKRDHNVSLNKSNTRRLTPARMSEKRHKGLCFFCDDKFVPGHKCNVAKQLYLLEICNEEDPKEEPEPDVQEVPEVEDDDMEKCETSIHALNRIPRFHTLRVNKCCKKRRKARLKREARPLHFYFVKRGDIEKLVSEEKQKRKKKALIRCILFFALKS